MRLLFGLTVDAIDSEKTIKEILHEHFSVSTRFINRLKFGDYIILNGQKRYVNVRVHEGDHLEIYEPEEESVNILATPIDVHIRYEDAHIMVLDKQAGLPVHPCPGNFEHTLANGVVYYWKENGENHIYRPVNRLDKDTSGLIIIAKSQYAHQQLSMRMLSKDKGSTTIQRKYTAIVHGMIHPMEGTIRFPIERKQGSILERCVSENGQRAVTHYRVLSYINGLTLVELELETGRTHQIRVHMSYMGHPLVGDWLYGKEERQLISRQALHSSYLEFEHPLDKRVMKFASEIPQDMKSCWNLGNAKK